MPDLATNVLSYGDNLGGMSSSAESLRIEPALATAVRFTTGRMHVLLDDGREISVPLDRFPRLQQAIPAQRQNWEIAALGTAIRWPDLDEEIGVAGLLAMHEALVERAAGFETRSSKRGR
jgi:hypothetical protein